MSTSKRSGAVVAESLVLVVAAVGMV